MYTGSIFAGQWQLLSIARATTGNPELLLLDEITANLDANTERDVLTALKGVSENRTVISISHRVTAKNRTCNKLLNTIFYNDNDARM